MLSSADSNAEFRGHIPCLAPPPLDQYPLAPTLNFHTLEAPKNSCPVGYHPPPETAVSTIIQLCCGQLPSKCSRDQVYALLRHFLKSGVIYALRDHRKGGKNRSGLWHVETNVAGGNELLAQHRRVALSSDGTLFCEIPPGAAHTYESVFPALQQTYADLRHVPAENVRFFCLTVAIARNVAEGSLTRDEDEEFRPAAAASASQDSSLPRPPVPIDMLSAPDWWKWEELVLRGREAVVVAVPYGSGSRVPDRFAAAAGAAEPTQVSSFASWLENGPASPFLAAPAGI